MDVKRFKQEYRLVSLFLKELGLTREWKEYCENKPYTLDYRVFDTIDHVFGKTNFTKFLKNKGIILEGYSAISIMFRAFLKLHAPHIVIDGYYSDFDITPLMYEGYKQKNLKKLIYHKK
jgi:hypothetical protein